MTHVLVVGGGVAGLLTVQALLDRDDDLAADAAARGPRHLRVTWLVHAPGHATASRSGGLALRYASTDARADAWTARSGETARSVLREQSGVDPLAAYGWWHP